MKCYRYIELNPVRAGMVDHPEQCPWSSYRENSGFELGIDVGAKLKSGTEEVLKPGTETRKSSTENIEGDRLKPVHRFVDVLTPHSIYLALSSSREK